MMVTCKFQSPFMTKMPQWILDVPFELRGEVRQHGVKWSSVAQAQIWEGEHLPSILRPMRAMPLSLEWSKQHALNGYHLEPIQKLDPPFIGRKHQKEAAEHIKKVFESGSPGFLLADEVGVGKTMSAWEFVLAQKELKTVLIITTAGALAHWRHTIQHAGWRKDQRIMIINYDRLGKLFEVRELSSDRRKGKRKRVAKEGKPPQYDLVLLDESHKGKNPTSARGMMMRKISNAAKFSIWMSATSGQDPIELIYLAPLLARATKSRPSAADLDNFVIWCKKQGIAIKKGAYGAIEWERNDQDIARIHGWLFGGKLPLGIRRLPQDIAGWPAMERQMMPIQLDAASGMAYAKLWENFRKEEMRLEKGHGNHLEKEKNKMRLRQEASWLRIPSTVGLIDDLLDQGKRVAISVAFLETQQEMARLIQAKYKIEPAIYNGKQNKTQNEEERLKFQKGKTPIIIFTVEEAISLHQGEYEDVPRVMLLHDVRWSSIQLAQIEGRCHRDGALAPVWWLAAEDTVEVEIALAMTSRLLGMKGLHGDPVGDIKAIEEILKKAMKKDEGKLDAYS